MSLKNTWNWIKKYKKDLLLTAAAILTLTIAVLGWHWTETADTPFWWNFWVIAAVACDLLFIVTWAILWSNDKKKK